ncbi:MAG: hypothetical protein QOJ40_428 [Verrucomicrobiota bacterium]
MSPVPWLRLCISRPSCLADFGLWTQDFGLFMARLRHGLSRVMSRVENHETPVNIELSRCHGSGGGQRGASSRVQGSRFRIRRFRFGLRPSAFGLGLSPHFKPFQRNSKQFKGKTSAVYAFSRGDPNHSEPKTLSKKPRLSTVIHGHPRHNDTKSFGPCGSPRLCVELPRGIHLVLRKVYGKCTEGPGRSWKVLEGPGRLWKVTFPRHETRRAGAS